MDSLVVAVHALDETVAAAGWWIVVAICAAAVAIEITLFATGWKK